MEIGNRQGGGLKGGAYICTYATAAFIFIHHLQLAVLTRFGT